MTNKELLKIAVNSLEEKKAEDIRIIDISKISVVADYFIIASGKNNNQLRAIADYIEENLSKHKIAPRQIEGYSTSNWILMDYIDIIIHIFNQEDRLFYDIERIWSDGININPNEIN